jgi:hypothetical protein
MGAFVVVKVQVIVYATASFSRALIVIQVNLFILYRTPEPLIEDIVQGSPTTVHTDADISCY